MKYGELAQLFKDRSIEISESGSSSAVYRARSYDRVVAKINDLDPKTKVTEDGINDLDLSDYMTGIATDLLNGKALKKVKKVKTKTKVKVKRKVVKKDDTPVTLTAAAASKLLKQLVGFMGIGPEKAQVLIDDGLTKINQLHMKKWLAKLPEETQLYLKLKPNQEIPHADIAKLEKKLKLTYNITLVGSYRRGKPTSRDIDIMITSMDEDIINKYLTKLKKKLTVYPYSQGRDKMSFILDCTELLKRSAPCIYKLDVFRVEPDNQIPMLLYSTGSKEFNIRMRAIAKKKGYLLNQKGLFKKQSNGETRKVPELYSEEDYFEKLEMDYLEPSERI